MNKIVIDESYSSNYGILIGFVGLLGRVDETSSTYIDCHTINIRNSTKFNNSIIRINM